jgi:hypothetical protein
MATLRMLPSTVFFSPTISMWLGWLRWMSLA